MIKEEALIAKDIASQSGTLFAIAYVSYDEDKKPIILYKGCDRDRPLVRKIKNAYLDTNKEIACMLAKTSVKDPNDKNGRIMSSYVVDINVGLDPVSFREEF